MRWWAELPKLRLPSCLLPSNFLPPSPFPPHKNHGEKKLSAESGKGETAGRVRRILSSLDPKLCLQAGTLMEKGDGATGPDKAIPSSSKGGGKGNLLSLPRVRNSANLQWGLPHGQGEQEHCCRSNFR